MLLVAGGGPDMSRGGPDVSRGGGPASGNLGFFRNQAITTWRVVGLCQIIYSIKVIIGKIIFRDDPRVEVPPTGGTSTPNSKKRSKKSPKR